MSKQIRAISFSIDLKLLDIQQHQKTVIAKQEEIKKIIDKKRTTLNNAHANPTKILPEIEMNRMPFIIRLQQELDKLTGQIQQLHQEKQRLEQMEINLKTKLKRIANYTELKSQQAHQRALVQQNNLVDEWAIQQSTYDES